MEHDGMAQMIPLPSKIRNEIYAYTTGSIIELECDEDGITLTKHCHLLRISLATRKDVLVACAAGHLQLKHTFRTPAAFNNTLVYHSPVLPLTLIRVVIFGSLTLSNVVPTENEQRGSEHGPNMKPLFAAWRSAFRVIPQDTTIDMIHFDLTRTFRLYPTSIARLIHLLSAVLQQGSRGNARCRILGRWAARSAISVVPETLAPFNAPPDLGAKYAEDSGTYVCWTRKAKMEEVDQKWAGEAGADGSEWDFANARTVREASMAINSSVAGKKRRYSVFDED